MKAIKRYRLPATKSMSHKDEMYGMRHIVNFIVISLLGDIG